MILFDLNKNEKLDDYKFIKNDSCLILCNLTELKEIKNFLELDNNTYYECLSFDENIKLDNFDKYDFLSVNTFELIKNKIIIQEVNIYLSNNFILVVCNENHFLNEIFINIINEIQKNNLEYLKLEKNELFFKIIYKIFKSIIIDQFENLEKLENIILELEDEILISNVENKIENINYMRAMSRIIVRNIRPYIYIYDRIFNENTRYKKPNDIEIQNVNYSIEKLYSFSLSTRELSDKLLDIYSSNIANKTNDLITKLTLLTAISSPLTIITGIYGMNFKYMPELDFYYAYPITIIVMILIVVVCVSIFKNKKLL